MEFMANSLVDAAADTIATNGGFEDLFRNNNCKSAGSHGNLGKTSEREKGCEWFFLLIDIANAATRVKSIFLLA